MSRGPRPKPAQIKDLEGNPGNRPYSKGAQFGTNSVLPPECLEGHALAEWERLSPQLQQLGLLDDASLNVFVEYCMAFGDLRHYTESLQRRRKKIAAKIVAKSGGDEKLAEDMMATATGIYDVKATESGYLQQHPLVGMINKSRETMRRFASEFGLSPATRSKIAIEPSEGGDPFDD